MLCIIAKQHLIVSNAFISNNIDKNRVIGYKCAYRRLQIYSIQRLQRV